MKLIAPSCYPKFRCIADRCRHSCCIGWEIDIDPDTLAKYRQIPAPFGDRLCRHIDTGDTPHFRLDKTERCPFLNRQGLCDIILTLGEDSLCQICADHPRFRNVYSDRTEIGLGLCCEAAAELILLDEEPVSLISVGETGEEAYPFTDAEKAFLALREAVFCALQDRAVPIGARLQTMLNLCGGVLPERSPADWAEIYRDLERLDPAWDEILSALAAADPDPFPLTEPTPWDTVLENLAVYFAFRHLPGSLDDDRSGPRAAFCALSVSVIHRIFTVIHAGKGTLAPEAITETARLYSSEVEYSEENMEVLLTLLED